MTPSTIDCLFCVNNSIKCYSNKFPDVKKEQKCSKGIVSNATDSGSETNDFIWEDTEFLDFIEMENITDHFDLINIINTFEENTTNGK